MEEFLCKLPNEILVSDILMPNFKPKVQQKYNWIKQEIPMPLAIPAKDLHHFLFFQLQQNIHSSLVISEEAGK